MDKNDCGGVARAAIADMGPRSIGQPHELRWRRGVFRFERGARNIGVAEMQKSANHQAKNRSNDDQKYSHSNPAPDSRIGYRFALAGAEDDCAYSNPLF